MKRPPVWGTFCGQNPLAWNTGSGLTGFIKWLTAASILSSPCVGSSGLSLSQAGSHSALQALHLCVCVFSQGKSSKAHQTPGWEQAMPTRTLSTLLWKPFTHWEEDWVWILKETPDTPSAFPSLWKLTSKPTHSNTSPPWVSFLHPHLPQVPRLWQQDHLPALRGLEDGLSRTGCLPGVPCGPWEGGKLQTRDRVCLRWLP